MPSRTEAVPITNSKKRREKGTAGPLARSARAYLPASTASVNAVFSIDGSRVVPAHTVVLQITKCVINRCPRWET